jgi:uncharacterized membrane protein YgdD (TMEM256/DUF423 family)
MQPMTQLRVAAILGGLAVALGAMGAHLMKGHYEAIDLERFEKAVRYQMYHALALGLCGGLGLAGVRTRAAGVAFLLGIALFSGSLYALVFTHETTWGHVTPFGGLAFLVAWGLLAGARKPLPIKATTN